MTSLLRLLLAALAPAAVAGVLAGLYLGWHYVAAGFPLLLADAVRRALLWTLAGTAVFVVLYEGLRRPLARRAERFAAPLAAGVAAVPFVALAGYHLNRSRAIRPSEFLEPYALLPNLSLLAACLAAYGAVVLLLRHVSQRPRARGGVVAVGFLAVLQIGVPVLFRSGEKKRPDVLVLLVDALRADHLGCYGYRRDTSPAIDSLAADGVVFRQAISQSTFTKTSIASLFTGRNPYRHGVYWGQRQVADGTLTADLLSRDETTLAEALRGRGYLTSAWVQNSHLRRVMGFAQGFVDYHDQQGSIGRIHRRFLPWLAGPGRRYSYFVYLHYIDLHDPYRPEPPYDTLFGSYSDVYRGVDFRHWGAFLEAIREGEKKLSADDVEELRALYDGQIRAVDDEIGRLLARLRRSGRYDDTLIVLAADHGDGFLEHGFISHSASPYEELVRVPLIVKLPRGRFAGHAVESQVRLVDVMPTVLAAVGVPLRGFELDGCDLLPWMESGERPDSAPASCAYAVTEIAEDEAAPTLAVRTERFKYIHREEGGDELYDLAADPGERRNLIAAPPEGSEPLSRLALELVARRTTEGVERMELDEKMRQELRALGYVGD